MAGASVCCQVCVHVSMPFTRVPVKSLGSQKTWVSFKSGTNQKILPQSSQAFSSHAHHSDNAWEQRAVTRWLGSSYTRPRQQAQRLPFPRLDSMHHILRSRTHFFLLHFHHHPPSENLRLPGPWPSTAFPLFSWAHSSLGACFCNATLAIAKPACVRASKIKTFGRTSKRLWSRNLGHLPPAIWWWQKKI